MMKTNPEQPHHFTAIYTTNPEYWKRLEAYYNLPWWKRLFKKYPKEEK